MSREGSSILRRLVRRQPVANACLGQMPPLLARLFANRGICSDEELNHSLTSLIPPTEITSLQPAAELLEEAIQKQWRVLVVGDFDVDGATSCALAIRCLKGMGLINITYFVPDRQSDGYGLSVPLVERIIGEREAELVMTVDTGIGSIDGAKMLQSAGVRLLITDHHLPDAELPQADAIVNPRVGNDELAQTNLAGVGVVYYLMLALRARLRNNGWFESSATPEPNLAQYLDLVALGTVADIVPLDKVNRILVAQGLARMRHSEVCPGIAALARGSKRDIRQFVASDLGFFIGPRLNAAGRLADMKLGVECLLADSQNEAQQYASQLERLNGERRSLEAEMACQAVELLEKQQSETDRPLHGCVLFNDQWHIGVIGIIASRIVRQLAIPTVIFASARGGELRGSARSTDKTNIRDLLEELSNAHPGMIIRFGGHSKAAGVTIKKERFKEFHHHFLELLVKTSCEIEPKTVITDGELNASEITLGNAQLVKYAAPWGQDFPEPVFDNQFEVIDIKEMSGKHLRFMLRMAGYEVTIPAVWFNADQNMTPTVGTTTRLVYSLDINSFNGKQRLQLLIKDII